ncbi:transcriptional regulator GcvA [Microvirgula curvata]
MSDGLPPLHTLPAFAAAARLGSFQDAAAQLALTPSAVSHRIRVLETHLGQALFVRGHRQVRLTEAGQRYLAGVAPALEALLAATSALSPRPLRRLRLSVAPALGGKWLVGQLAAWQTQYPDIELELTTSIDLAPLLNGEADLALRFGEEDWPGFDAWKLFDATVFPVCSPALFNTLDGLPDPSALLHTRLLRHPLLSWSRWFAAAGLSVPEPERGPRFNDALLMLEAAVAGQGVALMVDALAAPYLDSGALVRPLPCACPDRAFYAVALPRGHAQPWITDFIRWLVHRARG